MATRSEINVVLDKIKGIFGDKFTLNADVMEAWRRAFEMVPASALDSALQRHLENSKFTPVLADIREEALKISGGRFGGTKQFKSPEGLTESIQAQNLRNGMARKESVDSNGRTVYWWVNERFAGMSY